MLRRPHDILLWAACSSPLSHTKMPIATYHGCTSCLRKSCSAGGATGLPNSMIWAVVTMKRTRKVNTNAHRSSRVSRPRSEFRQRVPVEKSAASPTSLPQVEEALLCGHYASASSLICLKNAILDMSW